MVKTQAATWHIRSHLFLIVASFLLIIVPVLNKQPSQQISQQSVYAAAEFLQLVDTEEYGKSWEVTSDALKKILSREAWNDKIEKIRSFLGPIISRQQQDIVYTNNASDVPDGEYVVMTFLSSFESREQVIETVTLLLSDDNEWQVAGYHLR